MSTPRETIQVADLNDHDEESRTMIEIAIQNPHELISVEGYRSGLMWVSDLDEWGVASPNGSVEHYSGAGKESARIAVVTLMDEEDGRTGRDRSPDWAPPKEIEIEVDRAKFVALVHTGRGYTKIVDEEWDELIHIPTEIDEETFRILLQVYFVAYGRGKETGRWEKVREFKKVLDIQ